MDRYIERNPILGMYFESQDRVLNQSTRFNTSERELLINCNPNLHTYTQMRYVRKLHTTSHETAGCEQDSNRRGYRVSFRKYIRTWTCRVGTCWHFSMFAHHYIYTQTSIQINKLRLCIQLGSFTWKIYANTLLPDICDIHYSRNRSFAANVVLIDVRYSRISYLANTEGQMYIIV